MKRFYIYVDKAELFVSCFEYDECVSYSNTSRGALSFRTRHAAEMFVRVLNAIDATPFVVMEVIR